MAEYILKQAALDALRTEGITRNMRAYKKVQDIQAADMAPVRHGRWDKPLDKRRKSSFCCSECKKLSYVSWDFCPNCGAKMDGEEVGLR